jgi:hypothetical protein
MLRERGPKQRQVVFTVLPHLWKSSLDPAPCGDTGAIEGHQQVQQGSINALELRTGLVAQEG